MRLDDKRECVKFGALMLDVSYTLNFKAFDSDSWV